MSQAFRATLIGGKGFVGQHLHQALLLGGWNSYVAERDDPRLMTDDLGHVFYCAGLTADFRQRPYATVDAHVHLLSTILQRSQFASLTYLSSTRVYAGALNTSENAALTVRAHLSGDLYNMSKLMGESLCLHGGRNVRVVRLSNVYGQGMPEQNFLADILNIAAKTKKVIFRSSPDSEKDYISIADVVRFLPIIATQGEIGIYNLARGQNTTHASLAALLEQSGVSCEFENLAPCISFPSISTIKLESSFGQPGLDIANELPALFNYYTKKP
ncbi:MAG: SDR family oxidoreductase [Burkholderiales bacterium]|nr:SDR family oxidoreductase [Burkholderiales bacterium]